MGKAERAARRAEKARNAQIKANKKAQNRAEEREREKRRMLLDDIRVDAKKTVERLIAAGSPGAQLMRQRLGPSRAYWAIQVGESPGRYDGTPNSHEQLFPDMVALNSNGSITRVTQSHDVLDELSTSQLSALVSALNMLG